MCWHTASLTSPEPPYPDKEMICFCAWNLEMSYSGCLLFRGCQFSWFSLDINFADWKLKKKQWKKNKQNTKNKTQKTKHKKGNNNKKSWIKTYTSILYNITLYHKMKTKIILLAYFSLFLDNEMLNTIFLS